MGGCPLQAAWAGVKLVGEGQPLEGMRPMVSLKDGYDTGGGGGAGHYKGKGITTV